MIPDRRAAAVVLAVYALLAAAGYALAAPDPGAWGAWRPLSGEAEGVNDLASCHPLPGGVVAAVLEAPLAGVVEWSTGAAYRLGFTPSASCALESGAVVVGGSVGGRPAIVVLEPGGVAASYTVEGAWGSVVSLHCGDGRVAFAVATFNREVAVGVLDLGEGGGWAWLAVKDRNAWTAGVALTPGGAAAVVGAVVVNATPSGVAAYRVMVEGANVTLEGAAWAPSGLAVYGGVSSEPGGWGAGLVAWQAPGGWEGVAFNTSENAGRVTAARAWGRGFRLYYTPGSWWDSDAYASPSLGAWGLRIIIPYAHIVKNPHFDGSVLTVPVVDASEERRAVCLFLPRQRPAIIGPPGSELATVKPLSRPDWPRATPVDVAVEPVGVEGERLGVEPLNVTVERVEAGEWTLEYSGLDTTTYFLVGLAYSLALAAASYYALGLDRLPRGWEWGGGKEGAGGGY